jgi:type II secretory pathway pseudopilin PulG
MIPHAHRHRSRAFSLLEAMAVVVMVAIAVPPMAAVAQAHARAAGDAARRHTAIHLAVGVIEAILADAESTNPRLGFEGFARPDYLDHPIDGLRARLADMTEPAAAFDIRFDAAFSEPFTNTGTPAPADADRALRLVTVTAHWTSLAGTDASLELQAAVVNR